MESDIGIRVERIVRSLQQFCAGVCFLTFFFFFFQLVNLFSSFFPSVSCYLTLPHLSQIDFLPISMGTAFLIVPTLQGWETDAVHAICTETVCFPCPFLLKTSAMKNSHPSSTVSLILRDWDSHMESFVDCFLDYEVRVLLLWIVFCKFSIPPDFNANHFWVCQKYQDTRQWMFQLFRNFDAFCTLLQ